MLRGLIGGFGLASAIMLATAVAASAETPAGAPVTIGFSMPLTGGLAVNGTSGLLAMQIWAEDTNKKGGLLGRPVKLVYYDDQTNPSLVPGIYTKLLDVDKVDLVVSAYGTNVTAPALPVVIQHSKTFMGLFAMDVNEEFHYPKYFSSWRSMTARRRAIPPMAPGPTSRRPGSVSFTTRPTRRPRPTSAQSFAQSRRPIPTSSISPPTRRTASA